MGLPPEFDTLTPHFKYTNKKADMKHVRKIL